MSQEQSQASTYAIDSKNSGNEPEFVRTKIENSPFWMIKQNNKYFATMGKYKITEEYDTAEELEDELNEKSWDLIVRIAGIMAEATISEHETTEAQNQ